MASNTYLKFEEPSIVGSVQVPRHKGEIEVLTWSQDFVQPSRTTEPTTHAHFTFTKSLDSATNDILKLCWAGKQIAKATLTSYLNDAATDDYLTVVMEHVIISNYSISGDPGNLPVENVSLDYGTIQYIYKPPKQGRASNKVLSAKHNLETGIIE